MTIVSTEEPPMLDRAARLRQATHSAHERLDARVMAARPFENAERYGNFVEMQYRFMKVVEPLYLDGSLGRHLPDLAERTRCAHAKLDLEDLGRPVPEVEPVPIGFAEAVGWLYVAEGSNLGAAFLSKAAEKLGYGPDKGARHLAGHPDGRGLHWRRFKEGLDSLPLSPADEARAVAGAMAAFAHVEGLVETVLQPAE